MAELVIPLGGLVVGLAGVIAGVAIALLSNKAAGEQQRREHRHERQRHWCEQAARSVAEAEMSFAGLTSLDGLNAALIRLFDEKDMRERMDRATTVRTEVLTVAALTHDDVQVRVFEEIAFRLESVSVTAAALLTSRMLIPDRLDEVAAAHRPTYESMREGRADGELSSLTARQLFQTARANIALVWRETPT